MDERLLDAVEVCLAALRTGVDLDACLALYPDLADDLKPILEAGLAARRLSRISLPPAAVENRSRGRFLSAAAALDIKAKPRFSWTALRRIALVTLIVLLAFAISWNGLLVASAKSLPGDMLYQVKRVSERVNLRLIPNLEEKHQYESDFNLRRAEELKLLLQLGRVEHVSFEGTVTETTPEQWSVGGFTVKVSADTIFIGDPKIGQFIEVEGQTQPGGWVAAQEIHLRYFQYTGEVEQIEQDYWVISGTHLDLSPNIQLDPALHIQDQALALVQSNDDGKLTALAIVEIPDDVLFNNLGMEIILEGPVEEISAHDWIVAGRKVLIEPRTLVSGAAQVGDSVRIHAYANRDGSLTATSIELLGTGQNPFVQPSQDLQTPDPELSNGRSVEATPDSQESSLEEAEPEDDTGQTTVSEDSSQDTTQVESSDDHENADLHHEDDQSDNHNNDDQHSDDGSSGQHEDRPENDD